MTHATTDIIVHIVDDDAAMRDALDWLFRTRGVACRQWESGDAFLSAWTPDLPGCLLLDIRMPGVSGLEVFDTLMTYGAPQPVIFLSGHGDLPSAVEALKRGAADFIEKPFNDNELVDRVIAAWVASSQKRQAQSLAAQRRALLDTLSAREREVLRCVLDGMLNKQIADALKVTMRTVETHRARVIEKMKVKNTVELARLFGLDSPDLDAQG